MSFGKFGKHSSHYFFEYFFRPTFSFLQNSYDMNVRSFIMVPQVLQALFFLFFSRWFSLYCSYWAISIVPYFSSLILPLSQTWGGEHWPFLQGSRLGSKWRPRQKILGLWVPREATPSSQLISTLHVIIPFSYPWVINNIFLKDTAWPSSSMRN